MSTWTPLSMQGAPSAREYFAHAWTGTHLFVWGGLLGVEKGRHVLTDDGALYDPSADTWTRVASEGAPCARGFPLAVWTGTHVLVWGGRAEGDTAERGDGALYDPRSNSWTALPASPLTAGRSYASKHVVDGRWYWLCGAKFSERRNDGVVFDFAARAWSALDVGASPPDARWDHAGVWTGDEFVLVGGFGAKNGWAKDCVAFDPRAKRWRELPTKGALTRRTHFAAAWTGSELVAWGGLSSAGGKDTTKGALYDPRADAWRPVNAKGEPEARAEHTLLWTGREVLVWGGTVRGKPRGTLAGPGGLYDPAAKKWRALPEGEPAARSQHAAYYTGDELLVWGGGQPRADYSTERLGTGFRVRV